MNHTAFGHSITFYAQDWDKYPKISVDGDGKPKYGLEKNTWESWHLIPESRPTLPHPKQKTKIISDIPSINGDIDLSLKDKPYPLFENREGSFSFIYNPIYSYAAGDTRDWTVLYTEISRFIHGRQLRMILEDDPGWYWEGRFNVEGWTSNTDGSGSIITIGYSVQPYKMEIFSSIDTWLWDPFNFYNGVIPTSVFSGDNGISLHGGSMPSSKDIISNDSIYWFGYDTSTGTWKQNVISSTDTSWKHSMSGRFGDKPQIPIVWWKPQPVSGQSKITASGMKMIIKYVNDNYKIDYNAIKYKWYNPNEKLLNAVTLIEQTYDGTDGKIPWYKFKDNDLIFCDNYVNGDQYLHFICNGEIKIEFRRGSL